MAVSSSERNLMEDIITKEESEEGEIETELIVVSSTEENAGEAIHEADSSGVTTGATNFHAAFEATQSETSRRVTRFLHVVGHEGRANDLIYAPPNPTERLENGVESSTPDHDRDRVMVYFGGDVQDYPEVMELQVDNREHKEWNLENMAVILSNQFKEHHIVVVRPSRMQFRTYTCFDNFLTSNQMSVPELTPFHGALLHLKHLLRELSRLLEERRLATGAIAAAAKAKLEVSEPSRLTLTLRDSAPRPVKLESGDISIVGFSKGCAVLNQFLYEFHFLKTLTPDDDSYEEFLSCFKDMYWLDGGHNGTKNTWVTSRALLDTFTRMGIRTHVHVTPYQIGDDRRLVIRREEKLFSDSLHVFGASIKRYIHFGNLTPSISLHFQLLAEFGNPSTPDVFSESDEIENYSGGCIQDIPSEYLRHFSQTHAHPDDLNSDQSDDQ